MPQWHPCASPLIPFGSFLQKSVEMVLKKKLNHCLALEVCEKDTQIAQSSLSLA